MYPPLLRQGDQIRIISPSGVIDPVYIDGASSVLSSWGLAVTEGQFAREAYGRFAGTREQRIADLQQAITDPQVKAILCSRGGYGVAQIIDAINFDALKSNPKWLIGFSDITILHNAFTNLGIASVHAIMAKHLTELPVGSEQLLRLQSIVAGKFPEYAISEDPLNRAGEARGKLIGGNLSVLVGLRGTRFDLPYENNILFIEDVAEKPYHIDRMMQNLRLGGVLEKISGLVVGQFSDCEEDPQMHLTVSEIIAQAVAEYNYPVCFNFPAGHVDYNLPLVLGENVYLKVDTHMAKLFFEN
ncbi:MAG: peptidase LD-carboxypeptidase [Bacteroidetes bacterium]|nr:peptidase LD-carboxypeptidase [Bacteroidota bacterium]